MKRLALVAALVVLCGIAGPSARRREAPVTLLTNEECFLYAVDGQVAICHATQSSKNSYVQLTVSLSSCVEGHSGHENDVVAAIGGACPE
jgi:hypothetical protein